MYECRNESPEPVNSPGLELLEGRALMSLNPSGVISSTPAGANYAYTITLTNQPSSTEGLGSSGTHGFPARTFSPPSRFP